MKWNGVRSVAVLGALVVSTSGVLIAATPPAAAATGSLSGTVRYAGSGVEGVIVTAQGYGSGTPGRARTTSAADGSYAFPTLTTGTYKVLFDPNPRANPPASGRAFAWYGGETPSTATVVTLTAGGLTGIDGTLLDDADHDGLSDTYECSPKTTSCPDRYDPNTDDGGGVDDELLDGDEVNLTLTSPMKADTGVWGIPNGIHDGNEDPDRDRLRNADELNVTGGVAWSDRTDPTAADRDGDGLNDQEEVGLLQRQTDPWKADTDEDSVPDLEEDLDGDGLTNEEERPVRLNPLSSDSDGDTILDGNEDLDGDGLTMEQETTLVGGITRCYYPYYPAPIPRCPDGVDPDYDGDGLEDGTDGKIFKAEPFDETGDPLGLQPVANTTTVTRTLGYGGTATIDPSAEWGIDEATTTSLTLQVTTPAMNSGGTILLHPTGSAPASGVKSFLVNGNEPITRLVEVKLGQNGDVTLASYTGVVRPIHLQVIARFGNETCSSSCTGDAANYLHHRYRSAVGSTVYDGGSAVYDGTSPITVHPEVAIPTDPTGLGNSFSDVSWGVFALTHLPVPGADAAVAINLSMVGTGQATPAPNNSLSSVETDAAQRILTVPMGAGGTGVQVIKRPGKTTGSSYVRVALLGYFVNDVYYEAAPLDDSGQGLGDLVVPTLDAGESWGIDPRGLDGIAPLDTPDAGTSTSVGSPAATHVLATVSASNADVSGTVTAGGITQLTTVPGKTVVNTVLLPIDPSTNQVGLSYAAASGSVDLTVDVLGWFEYDHYFRDLSTQPTGSRYQPLTTPTQVMGYYVGSAGPSAPSVTGGTTGVPAHGVSQVMVAVNAWPAYGIPSGDVAMSVWGKGRKKPLKPQLHAGAARNGSIQLVVDVGTDGKIHLQTDGLTIYAQVTVIGYFTPYAGSGGPSVAVIGDSITQLSSFNTSQMDRGVMQINQRGIAGYDTRELRWWAEEIGFSNPDQTVVFLGTNDFWHAFAGYDPGYEAVDELRRYSTEHFPGSTCVNYVVNAYHDEIVAMADESPATRGWASFTQVLTENGAPAVSPILPVAQTYPANYPSGYHIIGSDGIHPTRHGWEALGLLEQQVVLGAVPSRDSTVFSSSVDYRNATAANFGNYVRRCG